MGNRGLFVTALVLLVVGTVGLALLGAGLLVPRVTTSDATARGEWIYRTATDVDGRPIPYAGGPMMRMACADCHGIDGQGMRTPMFSSPNITARNLSDPARMLEPGGNRGHTYTDELIRRAVTQGVDAAGEPLAWPMPRWRLTDQEWQDLLAYLKALP